MKYFKALSTAGSFLLLTIMPLACSTELSDGIIAPKLAVLWVGLAMLCSGICLTAFARERWVWPRRPVIISGALFLVWYAFCTLCSGIHAYSVPGLLNSALYLLLLILWGSALTRQDLGRYAGWCSLAAFITGLYAHLQRLTLADIRLGGFRIGDFLCWQPAHLAYERTIATMGNPDYFASYLGALLPLALSWALTRPKAFQRCICLLLWASSAAAMILTQTRSAWLGAAACVPVWLFMAHRSAGAQRRRLWLTVTGLAALVFLSTWGIYSWQKQLNPQLDLADRVRNFANQDDLSIQARYYFWETALRSAVKHPIIGMGSGGHEIRAMQDRDLEPLPLRYPPRQIENVHSQALQILAESGCVGLALLIAGWLLFGEALARQRGLLEAGLLASGVALWVSQLFICSTPPTDVFWIFLLAAAAQYDPRGCPVTERSGGPDMSDSMSDNGADISESDVSTGTDSAASEPEALDWHRMFLPVLVAVCGICLTAAAAFMSLRSEYDICQGENCANDGKMYLAKTGDAERANEYYLRAEQYYMRALEFSPIWRQSLIYRFLGNLVKDMYADVSGMKDRALFNSSLECFDCAVSFDSSDPFNYSNKAELLRLDPERLNDALEAIDAALRIDPRNPQYCYQKARILLELHRYTEARDLSMNGLTYCPNAPYLWDTLARAHRHTGEYGLAERDLENLVKLEPKAEGNAAQIRTIMKAE